MANLFRHVDNIKNVYKLPCVVAINRFESDTDEEVKTIELACREHGVSAVECTAFADGGKGAESLAKKVVELCEEDNSRFEFAYGDEDGILIHKHQVLEELSFQRI